MAYAEAIDKRKTCKRSQKEPKDPSGAVLGQLLRAKETILQSSLLLRAEPRPRFAVHSTLYFYVSALFSALMKKNKTEIT